MKTAFRSLAFLFVLILALPAQSSPLAQSPATLLRDFATSPVRWQMWGTEAVERAKRENLPIFLHVSHSTSELGQAMLRQSFNNEKVANELNSAFVCVVVDRDEHPGLAALYQSYVSTKHQLSGWPLNIWLTPDLKPIEGTTYLPPSEEWGKEGFLNVVQRVSGNWKNERDAQIERAEAAAAEVAAADYAPDPSQLSKEALTEKLTAAEKAWLEKYDAVHHGFGEAPKHLEPELLRALLARGGKAREAALATLRAIFESPVRDPQEGGFYRYAAEANWTNPYLQKLASDQARVALAYLDAAKFTSEDWALAGAKNALSFALERLRLEDGLFATAIDLTSELARTDRTKFKRDTNTTAWVNGFLLAALSRAAEDMRDKRFHAASEALAGALQREFVLAEGRLKRLRGSEAVAVPLDHAAVAYGFLSYSRLKKDAASAVLATQLLNRARQEFFDAKFARFVTAPAGVLGVWHRPLSTAPGVGDVPSAESLALIAVLSAGTPPARDIVDTIASGLSAELDDTSGAPNGAALLAAELLRSSASD